MIEGFEGFKGLKPLKPSKPSINTSQKPSYYLEPGRTRESQVRGRPGEPREPRRARREPGKPGRTNQREPVARESEVKPGEPGRTSQIELWEPGRKECSLISRLLALDFEAS